MEIHTSRFGLLKIETDDVIRFPAGLLGLEACRQWIFLADRRSHAVAWLQSLERPEIALPVVSPRRFVPGYQMRVARPELEALDLDDPEGAKVLAILGKTDRTFTLNLKAPLIINLERNLGRQVVTNGDLPVQFELSDRRSTYRRTA